MDAVAYILESLRDEVERMTINAENARKNIASALERKEVYTPRELSKIINYGYVLTERCNELSRCCSFLIELMRLSESSRE